MKSFIGSKEMGEVLAPNWALIGTLPNHPSDCVIMNIKTGKLKKIRKFRPVNISREILKNARIDNLALFRNNKYLDDTTGNIMNFGDPLPKIPEDDSDLLDL